MTAQRPSYKTCIACDGDTERVQLVPPAAPQISDGPFGYANAGAKKKFWSGLPHRRGEIAAFRCRQCGRMALYGIENGDDDTNEILPAQQGGLSIAEGEDGALSEAPVQGALSEPDDD